MIGWDPQTDGNGAIHDLKPFPGTALLILRKYLYLLRRQRPSQSNGNPGTRNFANQVRVLKREIPTVELLSDVTRWWRMGIVAPITTDEAVAPALEFGSSHDDGTLAASFTKLSLLDGQQSTAPFDNPLFRNKALFVRGIMAAMADLVALPEHEIWEIVPRRCKDITQEDGLHSLLHVKCFPIYGMSAYQLRRLFCAGTITTADRLLYKCSKLTRAPVSDVEKAEWNFTQPEIAILKLVWQEWTNAVQRFAYRLYPNDLVSARNQSAHFLTSFNN